MTDNRRPRAIHGDRVLAPPPVSAIAAIRRHPVAAALPVLLAVAAASLYGLSRSPHFTARSEIAVAGNPRVPTSGVALVAARKSAAQAYENVLYSTAVGERIGRRMGFPADTGFRLLPATDGLTFPLVARAGAPDIAIRLANVAAEELLGTVNRPRISPGEIARRRQEYRKASAGEHRLERRVATLKAEESRAPARNAPQRLVRAQTDRAIAALRTALAAREYRISLTSQPGSPATQLVARAVAASSDRWSRLWRYVLAALVSGGVVGAALATAVSDRQQRRTHRGFDRRLQPRGGRAKALLPVALVIAGAAAVVLATDTLDAAVGSKLVLAVGVAVATLASGAYLA